MRRDEYPFREWFDRGKFSIHKGRDYTVKTSSMVQMLRNKAVKHWKKISLKVWVSEDGNRIDVTVLEK